MEKTILLQQDRHFDMGSKVILLRVGTALRGSPEPLPVRGEKGEESRKENSEFTTWKKAGIWRPSPRCYAPSCDCLELLNSR